MSGLPHALGLARSLCIYHGIPGRGRRLRRFYAEFVPPGGLAFDLGAHVGSRVLAWRRLGARVVAVEPQPDCQRVLRWLFGRDRGVTLCAAAVGRRTGTATLHVSPRTPTVTTLSPEWAARAAAIASFGGVRWSEQLPVAVTTLDALIAEHGEPDFVKIDIEGGELAALEGLGRALPALSFEYFAALPDIACSCIDRLEQLGRYRYRACAGERFRWLQPAELDAQAMRRWLGSLAHHARVDGCGDIYARRVEGAQQHAGEFVHRAQRARAGIEP